MLCYKVWNIILTINGNIDIVDIRSKENLDNIKSHKADNTKHVSKDGTLQTGLNSEKINGKTASATPSTTEKTDLIGMIN